MASELFEDDLDKVAVAIKIAGSKRRPSRIIRDIENLNIDKYINQIEYIIREGHGMCLSITIVPKDK